jgi:3-hydroxyisobutyrate dehydrogenase-like beta-hydroxyacid dehydrogenase
MNLNVALQMAALGESMALARHANISDNTYFEVLEKNVSYSPLVKLKEPSLRRGDYSPQFSIKHMLKDMRLARGTMKPESLPQLDAVCERLQRAEVAGLGDEDFSALVKVM